MDIKIEGDPGTHNVFQEVKIGSVQHYNYNPNLTTVINYNGKTPYVSSSKATEQMLGQNVINKEATCKEVLNYVSCSRPFVRDGWKDRYMQLWEDILSLKEVDDRLYDMGKQQGTNFNRKLVAAILHFLDSQKVYRDPFNAKAMAVALEGDWEHSVRRELAGELPDDIKAAIKQLIKDKY